MLHQHAGASSSRALPRSFTWVLGFPGELPIPFREDARQFLETPPARHGDESLPKGRFWGTGEHRAGCSGKGGEHAGGGMSEVTKK